MRATFITAGGVNTHGLARWGDGAWSSFGGQVDDFVYALTGFSDPSTKALWVGGSFLWAGDRVSAGIAEWTCLGVSFPGDSNCDGVVNWFDIGPFVLALGGCDNYRARYPYCPWLNADCNGDGVVSFADINPFVRLLLGR